jgi:pimeloyl-ACP methyl ester carboxylesterase
MSIAEGRVTANQIEFSYLEAGSGPLALCLHGFPDTAWGWRHLLPALAEAGYHAVAPFQRGYAPTSTAPDGRYQLGALVDDANTLHEVLGGDGDAVIIGHDWGAMATYGAAAFEPDRWRRVVAAAVPPINATAAAMLTYDQLHRSWYIFFFQNPLADLVVGQNDLEFVARLWRDWSPGYDAGDDVDHVRAALAGPENVAAAIGYYRAMFQPELQVPELEPQQRAASEPTPQPTLYLHGADDGCMAVDVAAGAMAYLPHAGSRVEVVADAGHFLHLEQPEVVNRLIVEHVTAG